MLWTTVLLKIKSGWKGKEFFSLLNIFKYLPFSFKILRQGKMGWGGELDTLILLYLHSWSVSALFVCWT